MIGTLTNELNLPEPIVNAIMGYDYSYTRSFTTDGKRKFNRDVTCDFTTTQLIAPVRITTFLKKHGAHLTEDASDRIFSLFGNAIHAILENANTNPSNGSFDRYLVEKRFYADFAGGRVGGRIDVYDLETFTLDDYKICSRYVVKNGIKAEWTAQASINALLMKLDAGIEVKRARIIAMYRDWSKLAARRERRYPQRQVEVFPVPLWNTHKTLLYIQERIAALRAAEASHPPVCTEVERWRKPDQWALKKNGNKRATRLYDNELDARKAAGQVGEPAISPAGEPYVAEPKGSEYEVEDRPGEDTRCLNYCPVTAFCSYFRELMEDKI